jgi:hypothetical protein
MTMFFKWIEWVGCSNGMNRRTVETFNILHDVAARKLFLEIDADEFNRFLNKLNF